MPLFSKYYLIHSIFNLLFKAKKKKKPLSFLQNKDSQILIFGQINCKKIKFLLALNFKHVSLLTNFKRQVSIFKFSFNDKYIYLIGFRQNHNITSEGALRENHFNKIMSNLVHKGTINSSKCKISPF